MHRRTTRQKRRSLVSTASHIASGAIGAASLVIAAQAVYVKLTTPRLLPPINAGHEFEEDGLLIRYTSAAASGTASDKKDGSSDNNVDSSEFILVLVGDSPVEGIGLNDHFETLGGQTALAFSKLLRRSVRYWSYGKGGLTARGVEKEMVPLVQRLSKRYNATKIDAIVVMCGVNNVLSGHTSDRFGTEVRGLLDSLLCSISCGFSRAPIILIDLIDFALLPFLPFPLSKILSWRSQALQTELEAVVNHYQQEERVVRRRTLIGISHMPDYQKALLTTDHDSLLPETRGGCRKLEHFFAKDNFHPALLGNALIGKAVTNTYTQLLRLPPFQDDAHFANLT